MSALLTGWSRVWPELMGGFCRSRLVRTLMDLDCMHVSSEGEPAMSAHQRVSLRVFHDPQVASWLGLASWEQAPTAIMGKTNTKNSFEIDANSAISRFFGRDQ